MKTPTRTITLKGPATCFPMTGAAQQLGMNQKQMSTPATGYLVTQVKNTIAKTPGTWLPAWYVEFMIDCWEDFEIVVNMYGNTEAQLNVDQWQQVTRPMPDDPDEI